MTTMNSSDSTKRMYIAKGSGEVAWMVAHSIEEARTLWTTNMGEDGDDDPVDVSAADDTEPITLGNLDGSYSTKTAVEWARDATVGDFWSTCS